MFNNSHVRFKYFFHDRDLFCVFLEKLHESMTLALSYWHSRRTYDYAIWHDNYLASSCAIHRVTRREVQLRAKRESALSCARTLGARCYYSSLIIILSRCV